MLVRPVTDLRHSPDSGSANSASRSARPAPLKPSRMRSACAWNSSRQCARTAFGDTAGKKIERSAMCASPSLRIMLWPISLVIRPAGWSRREHVDALLRDEDVVAPRQQRRAELRHERDRCLAPHRARAPDRDRARTPARRSENAAPWTCKLPRAGCRFPDDDGQYHALVIYPNSCRPPRNNYGLRCQQMFCAFHRRILEFSFGGRTGGQ